MVWMETRLAAADVEQVFAIQSQVAESRAALPDAERWRVALFSRDEGGGRLRLLLSPSGQDLAAILDGVWRASAGPQDFTWTMLCGARDAPERLGVRRRRPASRRSHTGEGGAELRRPKIRRP